MFSTRWRVSPPHSPSPRTLWSLPSEAHSKANGLRRGKWFECVFDGGSGRCYGTGPHLAGRGSVRRLISVSLRIIIHLLCFMTVRLVSPVLHDLFCYSCRACFLLNHDIEKPFRSLSAHSSARLKCSIFTSRYCYFSLTECYEVTVLTVFQRRQCIVSKMLSHRSSRSSVRQMKK